MNPIWEEDALDPTARDLVAARLPLHHAVQLVAAVGQSLEPRAPDDGQQALTVAGRRSWLGVPVAGGRLRAGVDPVALELRLCDGEGVPLAGLALAGRTAQEGLSFLAEALRTAGVPAAALALPAHPADFPHHRVADGAPFPADGEAGRAQLALLFEGTRALLVRLLGRGTAVRLWPHHFDLGATLELAGLQAGPGVSPGDGADGAPYWYTTLWPRPEGTLPPLAGGGTWRTGGWAGAELPLARLPPDGATQRARVEAFLDSALAAAKALVAGAR